jgi:hypothetical protein
MVKKNKQPTHTSLVNQYLVALKDFDTVAGITKGSGVCHRLVMISLWHLRRHKAVDSVESDGQLWWFATPEYDTRSKTLLERTPEEKKRNRRKRAQQPAEGA